MPEGRDMDDQWCVELITSIRETPPATSGPFDSRDAAQGFASAAINSGRFCAAKIVPVAPQVPKAAAGYAVDVPVVVSDWKVMADAYWKEREAVFAHQLTEFELTDDDKAAIAKLKRQFDGQKIVAQELTGEPDIADTRRAILSDSGLVSGDTSDGTPLYDERGSKIGHIRRKCDNGCSIVRFSVPTRCDDQPEPGKGAA